MRLQGIVFLISILLACPLWAQSAASRLVIVANAAAEGSMEIARHYAQARGIPMENIISLEMPTTESIGWSEFVSTIWQPLQLELDRRGWIDVQPMAQLDAMGRRSFVGGGHRLSYLVLCRGVPLRIKSAPELARLELEGRQIDGKLGTNRAAIDSELSLLVLGGQRAVGLVRNPLFRMENPSRLMEGSILKVSRLDGPSVRDVLALIDRTLEAERMGLIGRAYVDVKGPYRKGEQWLESAAEILEEMDYPLAINRTQGTFPAQARFDAPALYFGWYAGRINGPFALPGFRFPPGAIALHIHSYSAATLRSANAHWCGPFVARGAAVTFGAVYEPYLIFMHYPNLILEALRKGLCVGDAAYYALPVLSWQNVMVGDPLYRPFKVGLEAQMGHLSEVPARLRPYVILRQAHRWDHEGKEAEGLALLRKEQNRSPSLVLGLELARILAERGDLGGAAQAIGFAPFLRPMGTSDWGLLYEAANRFSKYDKPGSALKVLEHLLEDGRVPKPLRLVWMRAAADAANAAKDMAASIKWEHAIIEANSESPQ